MAQDRGTHSARLRRQIFMTLRFGIPLTILGLAACAGALWLGLDAQGWLILGCGLIVVASGVAMLLLALGTSALFVEAAIRGRLRGHAPTPLKPPAEKQIVTAVIVPPTPAPEPSQPAISIMSGTTSETSKPGPFVF